MKTTKITSRAVRTIRKTAGKLAASCDANAFDLKAVALLLLESADCEFGRQTSREDSRLNIAKTCLERLDDLPEKPQSWGEWLENAPIEELRVLLFGTKFHPEPASPATSSSTPPRDP